ncbi:MAG: PEP-CTERM sorting domain-containing protein [Phycisphaerae bacterium]|nr:PEP-CTERM sorting domain-containing protein [Phycisphaerae bacterium]
MNRLLALAAIVALALPALALDLETADPLPVGAVPSMGDSTRSTVVYSNVATATSGYSRLNPPAEEIGDELLTTGAGPLDSVTFSVYNSSNSTLPLTGADLTLKFYNYNSGTSSFDLAGTLAYDNVTFTGLTPGYYTMLTVSDIAQSQTINLSTDILATLTISDIQGGAERVGQILFNPPTIGSSTDDFYRDGAWYWFGGSPVANFGWEIGVVPEPTALLLLGLAGLLARRR